MKYHVVLIWWWWGRDNFRWAGSLHEAEVLMSPKVSSTMEQTSMLGLLSVVINNHELSMPSLLSVVIKKIMIHDWWIVNGRIVNSGDKNDEFGMAGQPGVTVLLTMLRGTAPSACSGLSLLTLDDAYFLLRAFTYLSMLKQARKPRSYTIFEILIKWPTSVKSYWRPTGLLSTMMSVLIETQQMLPGSSWTRVFHWKRREGAALHSFHPIL